MQSRVEDLDISTDGTDYARRLNIGTFMHVVRTLCYLHHKMSFLSKFSVRAVYTLVSIMF